MFFSVCCYAVAKIFRVFYLYVAMQLLRYLECFYPVCCYAVAKIFRVFYRYVAMQLLTYSDEMLFHFTTQLLRYSEFCFLCDATVCSCYDVLSIFSCCYAVAKIFRVFFRSGPSRHMSDSLTELPARVRAKPIFFFPSPKSDYTVSAIKIVQFCM